MYRSTRILKYYSGENVWLGKKQLRKNKTTHAQLDPPRSTVVTAMAPATQISHVVSKLFVTSAQRQLISTSQNDCRHSQYSLSWCPSHNLRSTVTEKKNNVDWAGEDGPAWCSENVNGAITFTDSRVVVKCIKSGEEIRGDAELVKKKKWSVDDDKEHLSNFTWTVPMVISQIR